MKKHNIFKALSTGLLALTLVAGTFASNVKADAPAYNATDDKIVVGDGSVYAVIKEESADLAPDKFKSLTGTEIVLGQTGIKAAVNKDLYLVIKESKPTGTEKDSYDANFVVKANEYKKIAVDINYAAAADDVAISSVVLTPVVKGADVVTITDTTADVGLRLQYSDDNGATWKAASTFKGSILKGLYEKTSATKLLFRVNGTSVADSAPANIRPSKAVAVTVKPQKELKAVKVDYVKGTIAIKNGMDYVVVAAENKAAADTALESATWTTVLPYNKNGSKTTPDLKTAYVPVKYAKDGSNADSFTNVKVKEKSIDDLIKALASDPGADDKIFIYVRNSAAVGKAASKATCVELAQRAAAPAFETGEDSWGTGNPKKDEIKYAGAEGSPELEYLIVPKADLSNINTIASKWSKLPKGTVLTLDKAKSSLVYKNGSKAKVELTKDGAAGVYILVRQPAVKAKGKAAGSLSSEFAKTIVTVVAANPSADPAVEAAITWTIAP